MLSIIIPQYRTERWIRLCLRSLRRYTQGEVQVIVVDNNSGDESIAYLRGVGWIELIENPSGSRGSLAHREALDLGVRRAVGDWQCLFHSDTIVLRPGWDAYFLESIRAARAVGLSTLVRDINRFEPRLERWKRNVNELVLAARHRLRRTAPPEKVMSFAFFLQSRILRDSGFSFVETEGDVVSGLYHRAIKGKHPFLLLGRADLEPFLWHTSNVTSVLTGQIATPTLVDKFQTKSQSLFRQAEIQSILSDDSLDR